MFIWNLCVNDSDSIVPYHFLLGSHGMLPAAISLCTAGVLPLIRCWSVTSLTRSLMVPVHANILHTWLYCFELVEILWLRHLSLLDKCTFHLRMANLISDLIEDPSHVGSI